MIWHTPAPTCGARLGNLPCVATGNHAGHVYHASWAPDAIKDET